MNDLIMMVDDEANMLSALDLPPENNSSNYVSINWSF